MLNPGWDEGMSEAEVDMYAKEMYRESHPDCLQCERIGCIDEACPKGGKDGSCDEDVLIECHGELVHERCRRRFEATIENAEPR